MSIPDMNDLTFSFDLGYASIGWSVIESSAVDKEVPPYVKSCGVVTFGADDCLAAKRRENRRMRRTIRSRRKRIARMAQILKYHGLLSDDAVLKSGHPAPFWLAARALQGKATLNEVETWNVLRWYAHNRGYDGNALWANNTASHNQDQEDAERVTAARSAMEKYGTSTMAETITSYLELNTNEPNPGFSLSTPKYRKCNWAFPRDIVEKEVRAVLNNSALPPSVVALLLDDVRSHVDELAASGIRFPLRYTGSVLFGQLLPRLDNRIIAHCPITWADEYRKAKQAGQSDKDARKIADKFSKVPKADCPEFYQYRFARLLANLRSNGVPLSAQLRQTLMHHALEAKKYTKSSFARVLSAHIDLKSSNFNNYFNLTENADKALILVPEKGSKDVASGRAPYARPILKQVVEEVLRGEDPTKPALSTDHPGGEPKPQDGILYSISDPNSEVNDYLSNRSVDEQTNNPLVRHRLLILGRLVREMIERYAEGDPTRVSRCCIEVGREVRTYAGLTNKEIKKKEAEKMQSFHAAVKYYEKQLADDSTHTLPPLSANLIRKCRIAIDMGWKCPFTGREYDASQLSNMEYEHIVPYSDRRTNSMAALVLTFPEVNRFKAKRSALEFIHDCGGQCVPGANHLTILKEKDYKSLVEKLRISPNPHDRKRTATRKKLLLVDRFDTEHDIPGFTEGQMTQSSQLMRLASRILRRFLPKVSMVMIPGRVTAELRRAWKLFSCLDAAYNKTHADSDNAPTMDQFQGLSKEEIRAITHLHHAIDATALGLVTVLIPSGTNGKVWRALISRHLTREDEQTLRDQLNSKLFHITNQHQLYLHNVPVPTLNSLINALAESRVVQHIPADMSGSQFESNYKRILRVQGDSVILKKHPETEESIKRKAKKKATTFRPRKTVDSKEDSKPCPKIIGLAPHSKLRAIKAALVIEKNYAIALDPQPTMIRHHQVYRTLAKLRESNVGKPVRLLRLGDLIRITAFPKNPKRTGIWRIASIKDTSAGGLVVDMQRPESALPIQTHPDHWINVRLESILSTMQLLKHRYTGDF